MLVNTSNEHLIHDGGLAKNYNTKSGLDEEGRFNLQAYSDRWKDNNKMKGLPKTANAITLAGKLNSRYVLHCVGPSWDTSKKPEK